MFFKWDSVGAAANVRNVKRGRHSRHIAEQFIRLQICYANVRMHVRYVCMYELAAPPSIRIYIHTHTHMCIYELSIFSIFGTPLTVGPFRFLTVVVIVAVNDFVYEYTYKMLPSMRQVTHQPYNQSVQQVGEYLYVICSYRSGEDIGCTLLYPCTCSWHLSCQSVVRWRCLFVVCCLGCSI